MSVTSVTLRISTIVPTKRRWGAFRRRPGAAIGSESPTNSAVAPLAAQVSSSDRAPRHKFLQMVSKFESGGSPAAPAIPVLVNHGPVREGPHPARGPAAWSTLSAVGEGLIGTDGRQLGHPAVVGRQVADRVGGPGIAGEQERLAAAAAEILVAPRAAAARLAHPVDAAEGAEGRGVAPDIGERMVAH